METQHRDRFMQLLSDYEILALTYCQMDSRQNQCMSTPLERHQSDSITLEERDELEKLVAIYEHGSLLKAEAAAEAIRRMFIEQPTP